MAVQESNPVGALLKGFGIIEQLSEGNVSLADIARKMGLPKSSAHRLLATLVELDVVCKTGDDDLYSLTPRLFAYGAKALGALDLVSTAVPSMRKLRDITDETVHLAVRSGDSIVYLHKVDSSYSLRMYSRIGYQAPLYCTSLGKCLLAWLDVDEARGIVEKLKFHPYMPGTISDKETFLTHLKGVHDQGFACDDEEHEPNVICHGVPLLNHYNRIIAALSVSIPKFRYDQEKKGELVNQIRQCGREISEKFGCPNYPA